METTINALNTMNKLRKQHNPFKMIIEDFINDDFFSSLRSGSAFTNTNWMSTNYNPVNIKETETSYLIHLSVPGFSKENLEISLEGGKLTVTGTHDSHEDFTSKTFEGYTRKEFNFSNFTRSFNLPETVNTDSISAKCENGILTLEIAKKENTISKSKTIKIK